MRRAGRGATRVDHLRAAGQVGECLVADANERMHVVYGMYDVRVATAGGELVAEFRGHTRTIRKPEG